VKKVTRKGEQVERGQISQKVTQKKKKKENRRREARSPEAEVRT